MNKKILVIESDGAFAESLAGALASRGFDVRLAADGQEGIDLARAERPDAVVLCAELPRASGYAICNKVKKDPELRGIPLVITSAAAGMETFDQHRKLKTRAEEYLLKPFTPDRLVEALAPLVGRAGATPRAAEDGAQLVTLDDVEEIESTLAALEAAAAAAAPESDADLAALDAAFDQIARNEIAPQLAPPIEAAPPPAPEPEAEAADAGVVVEIELPAPASEAPPPPPAGADDRDAEIARLQDRVSELLVDAGRAAEERERLTAALDEARRALDEAQRRVAELEGLAAAHEGRVMKAYERLKGDEQLRQRARKALAVALQLLEGGVAAPDAGSPRRDR